MCVALYGLELDVYIQGGEHRQRPCIQRAHVRCSMLKTSMDVTENALEAQILMSRRSCTPRRCQKRFFLSSTLRCCCCCCLLPKDSQKFWPPAELLHGAILKTCTSMVPCMMHPIQLVINQSSRTLTNNSTGTIIHIVCRTHRSCYYAETTSTSIIHQPPPCSSPPALALLLGPPRLAAGLSRSVLAPGPRCPPRTP